MWNKIILVGTEQREREKEKSSRSFITLPSSFSTIHFRVQVCRSRPLIDNLHAFIRLLRLLFSAAKREKKRGGLIAEARTTIFLIGPISLGGQK